MNIALTSQELAQIRADLDDLLPDTCNILTLTRTSDSAGGWSESWGTATASVACRVDYQATSESVNSARLKDYQKAVLTMAYDVTVTEANRIEIGTTTWSVQGVNTSASWKGVKRVNAERL